MKSKWTIVGHIVTLCALSLSVGVFYMSRIECSQARDERVMKQEEADIGSLADLQIKVFEMKRELLVERKKLQGLQLKLKDTESLLNKYRLRSAGILSGETNGKEINEFLLKELKALKKKAGWTSLQFDKLREFVLNTYKLQKTDDSVVEKFNVKTALISEKLESILALGRSQDQTRGLVLDVNEELDVVAIGLGYSDGVTQGSIWQQVDAGDDPVMLRVIEIRKFLSLGVLVQGRLQDVLRGAAVERKLKIVK